MVLTGVTFTVNLEIVTNPTKERIADFHHGLRDYNSEFVSEEFIPLSAVITDAADQVVAGIDGRRIGKNSTLASCGYTLITEAMGLGRN